MNYLTRSIEGDNFFEKETTIYYLVLHIRGRSRSTPDNHSKPSESG